MVSYFDDATEWKQHVEQTIPGTSITTTPDFEHGVFRSSQLGSVMVNEVAASSHCVKTEPSADSMPQISATIVLEGEVTIEQGGTRTLRAGEGILLSSTMPTSLQFQGAYRIIFALIPAESIGFEALTERRVFRANDPTERLLFDYIRSLPVAVPSMTIEQQQQASVVLVQMIRLINRANREVAAVVAQPSRIIKALRYINEHLLDPDLSPARVAAAQKVSRRFLDRLFASSGTTLNRTIWEHRLQRAAVLLRDPNQHAKTVLSIALSSGFQSASHFSTAFRNRFGQSPQEWRAQPPADIAPT